MSRRPTQAHARPADGAEPLPAAGEQVARAGSLPARIGQRIRRRREELGITQQELAGTELTRGFISQLEKGIVTPSLRSLELIAARLYKPVAYFVEDAYDADAPAELLELLELALWRLSVGAADEAGRLLERARKDAAEQADSPAVRGRLAWVEGWLARARGADPASVASQLGEAVRWLRAADEPAAAARAALAWAEALLEAGQPEPAAGVLEELVRDGRRPGGPELPWELRARTLLGVALQRCGRHPQAVALLREVHALAAATGWWAHPDQAFLALGLACQAQGAEEEARTWLVRAARVAGALERPHLEGLALHALARASLAADPQQAVTWLEQAVDAYRRAAAREELADARAELAEALSRAGRPQQALAVAQQGLAEAAGGARVRLLLVAGQLWSDQGREGDAVAALEEAVRLAEANGSPRELATACSQLGQLLRRLGRHEAAGEYLARALGLYEST